MPPFVLTCPRGNCQRFSGLRPGWMPHRIITGPYPLTDQPLLSYLSGIMGETTAAEPAAKGVAGERQVFSRFECKYYLPDRLLEPIREHMAPFARPDAYASGQDHSYTVCSLYLDNSGLQLYRMAAQGLRSRFKLRMRYYDEGGPVFCEIKRRNDDVIRKTRTRTNRSEASDILRRALGRPAEGPLADTGEFAMMTSRLDCRPLIRVKYRREAYESAAEDSVRITFDSQLEQSVSIDDELSLSGDFSAVPARGVILEVKFTDRFPGWVRSMVDRFQLQRVSVPKYLMCVEGAVSEGHYLPPDRRDFEAVMRMRAYSGRA